MPKQPARLHHSKIFIGLGAVAQVLAAVVRHVDWAVVRCLVIAGPGFAKDAFRAHLDAEAVRRELRCVPLTSLCCLQRAIRKVTHPGTSGKSRGLSLLCAASCSMLSSVTCQLAVSISQDRG